MSEVLKVRVELHGIDGSVIAYEVTNEDRPLRQAQLNVGVGSVPVDVPFTPKVTAQIFGPDSQLLVVAAGNKIMRYADSSPVVWAVVYGNYEPAEVDSIWATKGAAEKHVETLADDIGWKIVSWVVGR
jgi:hypothetical protein